MRKLIEEADIFLENNAFGAMERNGLGVNDIFELVKNRRRGFIYARGNGNGNGSLLYLSRP